MRSRMKWRLSVLGVGVGAFLIAAIVGQLAPFVPRVHDEFSYLLAADTLLNGRLANPAPEVWQPFQSFHILVEPAYASKYPIGISAFVALGWALFGTPIAGCWLAAGVCAASIAWMLGGVVSRRWAVFGGLLVACHPAMQVAWSQTLMSGWLTACGSSLLAGGVFRLRRGFRMDAATACGMGVCLLALTRPFEGLVATLISAAILWQLWFGLAWQTKLTIAFKSIPVAGVPISLGLLLIGMQNLAITGNPSNMPYQVHERQYGVAPLFVFGSQQVPSSESNGDLPAAIRDYHYGWSLESYKSRAGFAGWVVGIGQAVWTMWSFWVAIALVPLLTCAFWSRYRLPRILAIAVVVQVLFSATVCWIFPHYLSPILPWIVVLAVIGLRRVFRVFVRSGIGSRSQPQRFVMAILAVQSCLLVINAIQLGTEPNRRWAKRRATIESNLQSQDGLHLVLVRYGDLHNVHQEWVYNRADLGSAKVLWARGEREDWNTLLKRAYGHNHTIWSLDADLDDAEPKRITSPELP